MRHYFILAAVLCVGCSTMENAAKGTFSIAWDAAEKVVASKIPALEGKVMDYAKTQADRALDSACQYAAEKTATAAESVTNRLADKYRIDVSQVDDIAELMEKIRQENERRAKEGQDPITTWGTLALLAGLGVFQVGKSAVRVMKPEDKKAKS